MRRRPSASLVLAAGVFAVYAAGACPTIYVGDSGELVTAVLHPRHSPPFGLPALRPARASSGRSLVPLGSIAFRMSLFSASARPPPSASFTGSASRWGSSPLPRPLRRSCSPSARASGARPTCSACMRSTRSSSRSPPRPCSTGIARGEAAALVIAFFCCGLGASQPHVHGHLRLCARRLRARHRARPRPRPRACSAGAASFAAGCCPTSTCRSARAPIRLSTGATRRRRPASRASSCGATSGHAPGFEVPTTCCRIAATSAQGLCHELLWVGAAAGRARRRRGLAAPLAGAAAARS